MWWPTYLTGKRLGIFLGLVFFARICILFMPMAVEVYQLGRAIYEPTVALYRAARDHPKEAVRVLFALRTMYDAASAHFTHSARILHAYAPNDYGERDARIMHANAYIDERNDYTAAVLQIAASITNTSASLIDSLMDAYDVNEGVYMSCLKSGVHYDTIVDMAYCV